MFECDLDIVAAMNREIRLTNPQLATDLGAKLSEKINAVRAQIELNIETYKAMFPDSKRFDV